MNKLDIKLQDFYILKGYLQAQLLLETLDDIEDESKMNIKHSTKRYKKDLESKITIIIENTFNTNKELFEKILIDMRNSNNTIDKYFSII